MSKILKSEIEIIEEKIIRLQRATNTIYPSLASWHTEMCQRSPLYYAWHKNPSSESIHWMILTILTLYLMWIDSLIIFSILMP